jgi:transcriptional regulator with GAF, ATPase, and Fis domain
VRDHNRGAATRLPALTVGRRGLHSRPVGTDDDKERAPHTEATLDPSSPLAAGTLAAERLVSLYDISRQLLRPGDTAEVIRRILDALVTHLRPERACILAASPDGSWRPLAAHGLDLEGAPSEWPLSLSVLRYVRETGLALLASDILGEARFKDSGSAHRFKIRSVLAVPLGPKPAPGLIYLDHRSEQKRFGREDLEFATAVSSHAALVLARAEEQARTADALQRSDERLALLEGELLRHEIVGRSPALLRAYDALGRFAAGGARVLLRGETGTGKELFARAYAQKSGRAGGAYVPVPIPALAPGLVESELFGHARGAFTEATRDRKGRLEMADKGVLFLDEVGDVEPALQVKLLRFLDSGELFRVGENEPRRVDALVVSATNRPLEKDVESGRLRADLLARLGHTIEIPPLRERPEDVPLLVEHFLERHARHGGPRVFTRGAMDVLRRHRWPFNVRELQQVVERTVCLVDRATIEAEDLPEYLLREPSPSDSSSSPDGPPAPLRDVVDEAERRHIERALRFTRGNRRKAIELLKVSPETFYRRLEEFGIKKKNED